VNTPTLKRRILLPLFGGLIVLLGTFAFLLWWAHERQIEHALDRDRVTVARAFQHELGTSTTAVIANGAVVTALGRSTAQPDSVALPGDFRQALPLARLERTTHELHTVLGLHLVVILNKRVVDDGEWRTAMRQAGKAADWDRFGNRVVHARTLPRLPHEIEDYLARPAASAAGGHRFDLSLDGRRYLGASLALIDEVGQAVGEIVFLHDQTTTVAGMRGSLGLAAILCLAIGIVAAWLIVRSVRLYYLVPLHELRVVAERAGRGELSRSATVHRSDELGDLARSMNQMIQELREAQEERTRHIVDAALDAVVSIDDGSRIVDWNAQAELIFGWSRAEAIGQPVHELIIPAEYREAHVRGMKRFLETGASAMLNRRVEVTALRRGGDLFPAEIAIMPLRTEGRMNFSAFVRDITERKQGEEALRKSEERFRRLVETTSVIPWEADPSEYRFTYVGPQAVKLLGYAVEQWYELDFWSTHLHPEDREFAHAFLIAAADRRTEEAFEYRMIAEDGHTVWLRDIITFAKNENGSETMLGFRFDITERKRLERQLLGSQRMEAVGRLAGGIAHDFNNLITAILGYASLVQASMPEDDPAQDDVSEISRAANRAAALTQQLLAFARKQVIQPKVVDLTDLVDNLEKMMRRLIGEHIRLTTKTAEDLWTVKIDPGQFEQVLVNLAVNARDAMPDGGQLLIETANERLESTVIQRAEVVAGEYVMIAVTDTGTGIDQQTIAKIFEPFFTTKEVGKGTGLGLATCYGIVKQAGGYIFVDSEIGRGTTFRIYVPRASEERQLQETEGDASPGVQSVLLVEDDTTVREFAMKVLEARGFHVLAARYGDEAVALAHHYDGDIGLLLTDVVMPQMDGGETARAVRRARPAIRVLYMSAHPDAGNNLEARLGESCVLLAKPFSADELVQRVQDVLDAPALVLAGH
jgi:two-component system cell cycle sensor histidine kinase/response regulator CckA